MAFSEFDGKTPNSFNFPHTLKGKLVGYMTIVLNKKIIWSVGDIKGSDLFNWEVAKRKVSSVFMSLRVIGTASHSNRCWNHKAAVNTSTQ